MDDLLDREYASLPAPLPTFVDGVSDALDLVYCSLPYYVAPESLSSAPDTNMQAEAVISVTLVGSLTTQIALTGEVSVEAAATGILNLGKMNKLEMIF